LEIVLYIPTTLSRLTVFLRGEKDYFIRSRPIKALFMLRCSAAAFSQQSPRLLFQVVFLSFSF
jgi:hypothetical protein